MSEVIVTNHAAKRLKQRSGLPKKAVNRFAEIAFLKGKKHADVKGRLKRYLDKLFLSHMNGNNIRVYGMFVFIFQDTRLITVLSLPKSMRGGVPGQ